MLLCCTLEVVHVNSVSTSFTSWLSVEVNYRRTLLKDLKWVEYKLQVLFSLVPTPQQLHVLAVVFCHKSQMLPENAYTQFPSSLAAGNCSPPLTHFRPRGINSFFMVLASGHPTVPCDFLTHCFLSKCFFLKFY